MKISAKKPGRKLSTVFLTRQHSVTGRHSGFQRPMYQSASEIVAIIELALKEKTGIHTKSVRALESGVVEEHALVETISNQQKLIIRIWPVFYRHDRRIEFKIYDNTPERRQLILKHLQVFARINQAKLVEK